MTGWDLHVHIKRRVTHARCVSDEEIWCRNDDLGNQLYTIRILGLLHAVSHGTIANTRSDLASNTGFHTSVIGIPIVQLNNCFEIFEK